MNQGTNNNQTNTRHTQKCSVCKEMGHDKRNCPVQNSSTPERSRLTNASVQARPSVNIKSCLYCIFDLETTGFSRNYHDIIEISAVLLDSKGKPVLNEGNHCVFHSVKPPAPIGNLFTQITGISNEMVATAPSFQVCGRDFVKFLKDNCKLEDSDNDDSDDEDSDNDEHATTPLLRDIVLVAHNGNKFDVPFLCHSLVAYGIDLTGITFKAKLDTLDLVKHMIRLSRTMAPPDNYQLGIMYKYVTGKDLIDSHRAEGDANDLDGDTNVRRILVKTD